MRAPIAISLSTKNIRDSNIFSCIRITPSHCVAVTIAIDIRSAGNAGHGWSSSFGTWPPRSSRIFSVCWAGTTRSSPSTSQTTPSRSKPMRIERRCSTPARAMRKRRARHRGKPDERADLDVVGPDRIAWRRQAWPARARSWCWCRCPRCRRRARPGNARGPAHAARRRHCADAWCPGRPPRPSARSRWR